MQIEIARVFAPLLKPSRYKGAWGGRGSGKSHYMAGSVVEHCLLNPGPRIVCIREVQKTLAQSAKLLIENKIQEFGVGSEFRVLYDRIDTPGGGLIIPGDAGPECGEHQVTRGLQHRLVRGGADAV